jgi:hypothetical protein
VVAWSKKFALCMEQFANVLPLEQSLSCGVVKGTRANLTWSVLLQSTRWKSMMMIHAFVNCSAPFAKIGMMICFRDARSKHLDVIAQ